MTTPRPALDHPGRTSLGASRTPALTEGRRLLLVPVTKTQARQFVQEHHRHNEAPSPMQVAFAVGLECDGKLVAVATAGRPVNRTLDDGMTLEVNRVCVQDGTRNANSTLYGAIGRAAKALGYHRLVTYTLQAESGVSLKAAGFAGPIKAAGVTQPGRNCAVHVQQVTTTVVHDGVTGQRDFRGDVIRLFMERGWTFHGEVTIDKDPQAQAIRTKSKGLLFVQKERDRSWLRPALADYILVFRAPGENAVPIRDDQITNDDWISWARPIWYGIRESATLNAAEARDERDEKHIAALQLETVRRCIRLWSNPDDLILDPFTGIGTTGYVAIETGRRFVGIELKRSYYDAACRNIARAEARMTLGLEVPA